MPWDFARIARAGRRNDPDPPPQATTENHGRSPRERPTEFPVDRPEALSRIPLGDGDAFGDNGCRKRLGVVVHDQQPLLAGALYGEEIQNGHTRVADTHKQAMRGGSAQRDPLLKIPPKPWAMRSSIPSGWESLVIRRAYLVRPIAVEYWGFSNV